jgi:FkbM family methyltransferase
MKFEELDKIPYINEHGIVIYHTIVEREEQLHVLQYVPADATVLELGARYGTVSCVVSSVLNEPTHHVAVEPDVTVRTSLQHNRQTHDGKFAIYDGVVSRFPVYIMRDGYCTRVCTSGKASCQAKNMSYDDLEKTYNMKFDCIVADMEGAFLTFLQENQSKLAGINSVLFESDGACDYNEVKRILKDSGLTEILSGFHSVWKR